ncbi:hypothetical protein [Roseomonas sp. WA12]
MHHQLAARERQAEILLEPALLRCLLTLRGLKPAEPQLRQPEGTGCPRAALLAEAGYGPQRPLRLTVGISTSGSGQMLPQPMNEALQESLRERCGVQVEFRVVEWNTLLGGLRASPDQPAWLGADALNISLVSSDPSQMARWFLGANVSPRGSNAGHWVDPQFDAAFNQVEAAADPAAINAAVTRAHERLVDGAPWLYVVHDLNPRAMTRRVTGFTPAQSWFQDLTTVDLQ